MVVGLHSSWGRSGDLEFNSGQGSRTLPMGFLEGSMGSSPEIKRLARFTLTVVDLRSSAVSLWLAQSEAD